MEETERFDPKKWLEEYDLAYPKFEWFIIKYCKEAIPDLADSRKSINVTRIMAILNSIWFDLPDHKFNIVEMPEGWHEFLNLLEQ